MKKPIFIFIIIYILLLSGCSKIVPENQKEISINTEENIETNKTNIEASNEEVSVLPQRFVEVINTLCINKFKEGLDWYEWWKILTNWDYIMITSRYSHSLLLDAPNMIYNIRWKDVGTCGWMPWPDWESFNSKLCKLDFKYSWKNFCE